MMDVPPPPTIPPDTPPAVIEQMEQPRPVTRECLTRVVERYQVHPIILSVVAGVEGGEIGSEMENTNATQDLGIMQINTIHLEKLAEHGITRKMVANNGCVNVSVAAWYLREVTQGVTASTPEELFSAIARYHSHTDEPNRVYTDKLMEQYRKLIGEMDHGR